MDELNQIDEDIYGEDLLSSFGSLVKKPTNQEVIPESAFIFPSTTKKEFNEEDNNDGNIVSQKLFGSTIRKLTSKANFLHNNPPENQTYERRCKTFLPNQKYAFDDNLGFNNEFNISPNMYQSQMDFNPSDFLKSKTYENRNNLSVDELHTPNRAKTGFSRIPTSTRDRNFQDENDLPPGKEIIHAEFIPPNPNIEEEVAHIPRSEFVWRDCTFVERIKDFFLNW